MTHMRHAENPYLGFLFRCYSDPFSPFAAAGRSMRLHRRGVDEDLHRRTARLRKRVARPIQTPLAAHRT